MNFKYAIGDLVMQHDKTMGRTTPYQILERMSKECCGGTQLFYVCEFWDGKTGTFAEDSLIAFSDYLNAWVKWFEVHTSVKSSLETKAHP